MAPGYGSGGIRGKVDVQTMRERPYTDETLRLFSYKPIRDVTVADVLQIIDERGRDAFNFSPEWEGCRFWMTVIMKDLEDDKVVDEGSAIAAMEGLLQYWINPEGSETRVLRQGIFRSK